MSTVGRTSGPSAAYTAQQSSTESFNPTEYLDSQVKDGQYGVFVAGMGESYAKNFEKNVREAVSQLGPNATKEQVDKAMSSEASKQLVAKSVVDMASRNVMNRIKELSSDTFQE